MVNRLIETGEFNPLTQKNILWVLQTTDKFHCFRCKREITDGDYGWYCPADKDFLCIDCGKTQPKFHNLSIFGDKKQHTDYFVKVELKTDIS